MHISRLDFDAAAVEQNIARLTALGVQVHITELDVSLPLDSDGAAAAEDLNQQANVYRGIVRACLNHAGCTAIQTWGFTDKYSWIGSHSRGTRGQALPFDRTYQPKAAYRAVLEELSAGRNARALTAAMTLRCNRGAFQLIGLASIMIFGVCGAPLPRCGC